MRFKCRFLKKKFLLLLITLGIGSALYANDELKSLADSLRRMIDEKPLFIQQKEQRINRIKCLLKGSGLTLEQKYKINFQLCNEYKKFLVQSQKFFITLHQRPLYLQNLSHLNINTYHQQDQKKKNDTG